MSEDDCCVAPVAGQLYTICFLDTPVPCRPHVAANGSVIVTPLVDPSVDYSLVTRWSFGKLSAGDQVLSINGIPPPKDEELARKALQDVPVVLKMFHPTSFTQLAAAPSPVASAKPVPQLSPLYAAPAFARALPQRAAAVVANRSLQAVSYAYATGTASKTCGSSGGDGACQLSDAELAVFLHNSEGIGAGSGGSGSKRGRGVVDLSSDATKGLAARPPPKRRTSTVSASKQAAKPEIVELMSDSDDDIKMETECLEAPDAASKAATEVSAPQTLRLHACVHMRSFGYGHVSAISMKPLPTAAAPATTAPSAPATTHIDLSGDDNPLPDATVLTPSTTTTYTITLWCGAKAYVPAEHPDFATVLRLAPSDTIGQACGFDYKTSDVYRTNPGIYLNDTLIEIGLRLITNTLPPAQQRHVKLCSTYFITLLNRDVVKLLETFRKATTPTQLQAAHDKLASGALAAPDFFERMFTIVPVNDKNHWSVAIIAYPALLMGDASATFRPVRRPLPPHLRISGVTVAQQLSGRSGNASTSPRAAGGAGAAAVAVPIDVSDDDEVDVAMASSPVVQAVSSPAIDVATDATECDVSPEMSAQSSSTPLQADSAAACFDDVAVVSHTNSDTSLDACATTLRSASLMSLSSLPAPVDSEETRAATDLLSTQPVVQTTSLALEPCVEFAISNEEGIADASTATPTQGQGKRGRGRTKSTSRTQQGAHTSASSQLVPVPEASTSIAAPPLLPAAPKRARSQGGKRVPAAVSLDAPVATTAAPDAATCNDPLATQPTIQDSFLALEGGAGLATSSEASVVDAPTTTTPTQARAKRGAGPSKSTTRANVDAPASALPQLFHPVTVLGESSSSPGPTIAAAAPARAPSRGRKPVPTAPSFDATAEVTDTATSVAASVLDVDPPLDHAGASQGGSSSRVSKPTVPVTFGIQAEHSLYGTVTATLPNSGVDGESAVPAVASGKTSRRPLKRTPTATLAPVPFPLVQAAAVIADTTSEAILTPLVPAAVSTAPSIGHSGSAAGSSAEGGGVTCEGMRVSSPPTTASGADSTARADEVREAAVAVKRPRTGQSGFGQLGSLTVPEDKETAVLTASAAKRQRLESSDAAGKTELERIEQSLRSALSQLVSSLRRGTGIELLVREGVTATVSTILKDLSPCASSASSGDFPTAAMPTDATNESTLPISLFSMKLLLERPQSASMGVGATRNLAPLGGRRDDALRAAAALKPSVSSQRAGVRKTFFELVARFPVETVVPPAVAIDADPASKREELIAYTHRVAASYAKHRFDVFSSLALRDVFHNYYKAETQLVGSQETAATLALEYTTAILARAKAFLKDAAMPLRQHLVGLYQHCNQLSAEAYNVLCARLMSGAKDGSEPAPWSRCIVLFNGCMLAVSLVTTLVAKVDQVVACVQSLIFRTADVQTRARSAQAQHKLDHRHWQRRLNSVSDKLRTILARCASPPAPAIILLDSLKVHRLQTVARLLRHYVELLSWDQFGSGSSGASKTTSSLSTGKTPGSSPIAADVLPSVQPSAIPRQDNDCDCGVFLLQYAEGFVLPFLPYITADDISDELKLIFDADWFHATSIDLRRQSFQAALLTTHAIRAPLTTFQPPVAAAASSSSSSAAGKAASSPLRSETD